MSSRPARIILASASPRRQELLKLICSEFDVIPSQFDESTMPPELSSRDHVILSAREKSRDVAAGVTDAIVIGADTVVSIDEHVLGKPQDQDDARRMLRLLSGRIHQVYTGIHVIDMRGVQPRERGDCECTDVKFRELTDEMIAGYVATGEPLDKAGAYAIQGRGAVLIEGINGDFLNVVGLPVCRLSRMLEDLNLDLLVSD